MKMPEPGSKSRTTSVMMETEQSLMPVLSPHIISNQFEPGPVAVVNRLQSHENRL